MADGVKQVLAKPIQLADMVAKTAGEARVFKTECLEAKNKAERLAALLRQAARADLYERPTRRIMDDTEHALDKALALVTRCRDQGIVRRVFTIIPANAFKKISLELENAIGNVSWLLQVSKSSASAAADDEDDDGYLGMPPIATNEPILCLIWEQVAKLLKGSPDEKADAAPVLVSFARDNDRYGKLIIEEGGVGPLLKLIKEGKVEAQESAAHALGLLGKDPESVEVMIQAGVCSAFTKVLKEAPMKVQAMVAWAVSELANHYPHCQDSFAQNNAVRLLVGHLAFETVQEHSKYSVVPKATSIHSIVVANANAHNVHIATSSPRPQEDGQSQVKHPLAGNRPQDRNQMQSIVQTTMAAKPSQFHNYQQQQQIVHHHHYSSAAIRAREQEDPATKSRMKAMAAKALWALAKGNSPICKSITESRALLCFSVLLEKGTEEIRSHSAMALMEIARVAEIDPELRRFAFKPTSPAAKAVVDQLLRVVQKADYNDLLVPSIVALGCLSKTFRATETRIIAPLVKLLDEQEPEVILQSAIALTKFAETNNYLHKDHCKAIIEAGGAKHLVQLVYLGEDAKMPALTLLCYVAKHVPDSEELANAEVLTVLEWASKQSALVQDETIDRLLPEAKSKLELYQSRGGRGFH